MNDQKNLKDRLSEYQRIETVIQNRIVDNRAEGKDRDTERILCLAMLECMDKIYSLRSRIEKEK